jgi:hypothetical protein
MQDPNYNTEDILEFAGAIGEVLEIIDSPGAGSASVSPEHLLELLNCQVPPCTY